MTNIAKLREFARRYTAAWCSGQPERVAEFYAPEGSLAINGGPPSVGRAAIAQAARGFMEAFPDLSVRMDDVMVQKGRIEYHWTLTGTNRGPGASGKQVRICGFESWILSDGRLISKSEGTFDATEYQRQLESGYGG